MRVAICASLILAGVCFGQGPGPSQADILSGRVKATDIDPTTIWPFKWGQIGEGSDMQKYMIWTDEAAKKKYLNKYPSLAAITMTQAEWQSASAAYWNRHADPVDDALSRINSQAKTKNDSPSRFGELLKELKKDPELRRAFIKALLE
jgi:hypothetical protein